MKKGGVMKKILLLVTIPLYIIASQSDGMKVSSFTQVAAQKLIDSQPVNEKRTIDQHILSTALQRTTLNSHIRNTIKDEGRIKALYMEPRAELGGSALLLLHALSDELDDHQSQMRCFKLKLQMKKERREKEEAEWIKKSRWYLATVIGSSVTCFTIGLVLNGMCC